MRYFLSVFAFMLCVCIMLAPASSVAQDQEQFFYSYGEVLSVMQDQIMVREFDYETGEEKEVVYFITADTIFDLVESADQIIPGNLVDVEFTVSGDGKNIAKEIFVDSVEDYEDTMD